MIASGPSRFSSLGLPPVGAWLLIACGSPLIACGSQGPNDGNLPPADATDAPSAGATDAPGTVPGATLDAPDGSQGVPPGAVPSGTPTDSPDDGAPASPDATSPDPVDGDDPASGPTDGLSLGRDEVAGARLHRLTTSEVVHSLQDLFGEDVPIGELEPDSHIDGFSSIGASFVFVSPAGVDLHEQAILAATEYVFADPARAETRLPCTPVDSADAACLEQVVSQIGRRAFRRPLTSEELQRYTELATTIGDTPGADITVGMRHALSAILQSPYFLYRIEMGEPSTADGGRLKYTDFEMGSRLAAMFWDSLPDDTLLDAAEAGDLGEAEGVRAQAERLLADPKAERAIAGLTYELFGLDHLEEAHKDQELFPTWNDSLKEAMREELEMRVLNMVFERQGDFLSLYDDRTTFVNNELANFYGITEPGEPGFHPAEFPPESNRAGLLGAGAILAGYSLPQRTSPTARGKFVAENLLCRTVPLPQDDVPPLPQMTSADQTLRERLELHREDPGCSACHALMDPMGFGMEDFDSVGLYRTMDGQNPVDATGDLTGPGLDGSTFNGLAELGAALRQQPILGPCLVKKVYSEALGRTAVEADRPALDELSTTFAESQHRLGQLLVTLATSESFRFVEPQD